MNASSLVTLLAGALGLMMTPATAAAQQGIARQTPIALMPLPSSLTRGEGAFTVSPAGGSPSTFTYNFGPTHDARLEGAT